MKVILLQDVDKLGAEGDVVTVKDGFGRNYLIPKKLAVVATPGTVRAREEERRQASRKLTQQKNDALGTAKELENIEIEIGARVGEEERIFGTITSQDIAEELARQGFRIDRRRIELKEDIRMLGVYPVTAKLHAEVTAQFKVRVVPEQTEA
jgi:large subunit ribosomal protein L9